MAGKGQVDREAGSSVTEPAEEARLGHALQDAAVACSA